MMVGSKLKRLVYCKKSKLLKCVALVTIVVIVCELLLRYDTCLGWKEKTAVDALCKLYLENEVDGNMCHELCTDKRIKLGTCGSNHADKNLVIAAQWRRKPIVLKSRNYELHEYFSPGGVDFDTATPSIVEFTHMVKTVVQNNFYVSIQAAYRNGVDILDKLWSIEFLRSANNSRMLPVAMRNVWSLVQQYEYILFKYFEDHQIFPRVLGTCGHVYAIEYLQPLTVKFNGLSSWSEKLTLARNILQLLEKLETGFHEPLHLCDVKREHFGVDDDLSLKILDTDTAYFRTVLNRMTQTYKPCAKHDDCGFWDCKSSCNLEKNICDATVLNNNLQAVCEKVFVGSNSVVAKHFEPDLEGLLQPIPEDGMNILQDMLDDCSNPNQDPDPDIRHAASNALLERLKLYLANYF